MPIYDRMFRMESVPNALEQAKQAAAPSPAARRRPARCPWQWSDQYDLKLQIAGYAFDVDEILVRGDPATAKFAVFHLKGDLVQSVEAINSPPEFMMGKQLILGRKAGRQGEACGPVHFHERGRRLSASAFEELWPRSPTSSTTAPSTSST